MKVRTITLTDRPPVRIREQDWPVVAIASYHDIEGEYECQSDRWWRGFIRVRRHEDGRMVVYARSWNSAPCYGEHEYDEHAGELLTADDTDGLIGAIHRVHNTIGGADQDHHDSWRVLAAECIAALPAVTI